MKVSLLIFFLCFFLFPGCRKLVDTPDETCFIPYVDFVAHHVNPATLDVTFTTITSYNGTITDYLWDFGDGTTYNGKIPPPHHYPSPSGSNPVTYRIKNTVRNSCGEAFWTNDITISACLPDPNFTYSFLNDSTVQFNNLTTSPTPATYTWNFGDGTTSTSSATTVTKTYHQDQSFTVSLKATNACGDNFYTSNVAICRPAVPAQTITVSCASVAINASATQNGARYQWNFGNGTILPATPGTASSINYTYPTAGTYNITLSVINPGGCDTAVVSNPVTVTGNTLSGPNTFDYTSDDLEYQFTRSTIVNATTYSWNFGDGTTSTQQNPSKTFNDPGEYTLTMGASNSCGAQNFTAVIKVPYYKALNNPPNTGFQDVVALTPFQIYYLGTNGKMYKADTAGNWSSAINLPSSLNFNSSTRLFKDINNNLWIFGKGEVAKYNVSSFTWTSYFSTTGFSNNTTLNSIAVESDGTLWTSDDRQIKRGNTVINTGTGNDFSSIAYAPSTGRIWVTASNKNVLYYVNVNSNSLNTVNTSGISGGAGEISVAGNGDLYLTTGVGMIRANSSGTLLNSYNSSNTGGLLTSDPKRYELDKKNNLWAVHNGRLLKIPANGGSTKNYSFNSDLNTISGIELLFISGNDTDILLAKTSGNVATKVR